MKRAIITGAAGFIGSHLAKTLVESGKWYVDYCDNLSNGKFENLQGCGGIKFICDFTDDLVLDKIRDQVYDVVFHMAAVPRVAYSVEHPFKTTEENLTKSVKLLEACKGNISRFVFSSSSSVYGNTNILPTPPSHPKNPRSPYALQKSCMEEYIKMFCDLYDMDAISLRYFNVFGPRSYGNSPYATAVAAWCNAIKDGQPLRSDGDGEQSRDMTYVQNVVDANIRAASITGFFNGECYNVGCGQRITNNQILAYFKERFKDIKIIEAPERPGDVRHTQANIEDTIRILGYEPSVGFWEGLNRTIEWWGI